MQMLQKKEMEQSRDIANNTFKPAIKTTKKTAQQNRNFGLLYNDLIQFQQKQQEKLEAQRRAVIETEQMMAQSQRAQPSKKSL